ncbi:AAA family ATPase [Paraburkholderia sp. DHOC27]|uniref:AAA family ATPase n=1 Tax=Paraburkholderia sp. DHOC27 TaxID=2303330 RepID=UPI000E3D495E|nr:AAA family ATPase [Paraburkholderia sp. DHOC27]RFU46783.1 hypothetical protein D0B32_17455 [Paraburkholderia sp. DHOC27]
MSSERDVEAELARAAELIETSEGRREQIERGRQRAVRGAQMAAAHTQQKKVGCHATRNDEHAGQSAVLLQCAADVKPQPVLWLWPDWLPVGKLTVLAGSAGTGKTTLALALAAVVTHGGQWPDVTGCGCCGQVLMWSSEDDPADTLVPRLMAAGADLSKVHFVGSVAKADGELAPFDPARDLPLLSERIARMDGARLLIVDPVLSAIGGDAHRANDVRRDLQPLVDLAARHGCAVIGISHFSKGSKGNAPVERVIGSQAFGALARMVLVTAKEEGTERRILARAKSNIAPDDGGFAYALERVEVQAGIRANVVIWGERIEGSARDILGDVEQDAGQDSERSERDEAKDFLRSLLADGPVPVKMIQADARGAGLAWRTIERAKRELGADARKPSGSSGWWWALSEQDRQGRHQEEQDRQTDSGGGLGGAWRSSAPAMVYDPPLSSDFDQDRQDRHVNGSGGLRPQDDDEVEDSV